MYYCLMTDYPLRQKSRNSNGLDSIKIVFKRVRSGKDVLKERVYFSSFLDISKIAPFKKDKSVLHCTAIYNYAHPYIFK